VNVLAPRGLTLVQAYYDSGNFIELTFDRAIDAWSADGSQIVVDDGVNEFQRFAATGWVMMVDSVTVDMGLVAIGPPTGPHIRLTAGAQTGIVAIDDGGTWAGVTDLGLPFP
jgi:hypothetical protein